MNNKETTPAQPKKCKASLQTLGGRDRCELKSGHMGKHQFKVGNATISWSTMQRSTFCSAASAVRTFPQEFSNEQ